MGLPAATMAALLSALMLVPPTGHAATVRVDGETLIYEAAPRELNVVHLNAYPDMATVGDPYAPLTAGAGCAAVESSIECQGPLARVSVALGDGNDQVWLYNTEIPAQLLGGDGNDQLRAAGSDDELDGEGGDDRLFGGPGADALVGGDGYDDIDAGAGPDRIEARELHPPGSRGDALKCGAGRDEVLAEREDFVYFCEVVNGVEGPGAAAAGPGGWERPITLARSSGSVHVAMTPGGEALALWSALGSTRAFGVIRVLAWPASGAPGAQTEVAAEADPWSTALAGAADGTVFAAWRSDDVRVAERPPGGAFGAAEVVPDVSQAGVFVSHGGTPGVGSLVDISVRDDSGSWRYPTSILDEHPPESATAVTDAGDVYALWTTSTGEVAFGRVRADGTSRATEVLAPAGGKEPQLALDGAGNAVAMWRDDEGLKVAQRPAGGGFGDATIPPGGHGGEGGFYLKGAIVSDRSGRITVAARRGGGPATVTVSSARFGGSLEQVAIFSTDAWYESAPELAVSPAGNVLLAWRADFEGRWVTTRRLGDGPFGPVEDLDPDCHPSEAVELAIADSGRAVAGRLYYERATLSVGVPPEGVPRQGCALPEVYGLPRVHGENPPDLAPWRPPKRITPGSLEPAVVSATLERGGRRAHVGVSCPLRCTVRGTVALRRAGRTLARGRLTRRRVLGTRTAAIPLRRLLGPRRSGGRARARLVVRLRVSGRRGSLRLSVPVGRRL